MQTNYEAEQLSIYDLDSWCGRTFPEPSPAEHQKEKTSGVFSRRSPELRSVVFQSLDLTHGHGNLLGESYWELISPWRGDASTLNTGVSPREENGSSLSRILQEDPPKRYFLTRKACLGILRRAAERGKGLPEKLKRALEMQAGLVWPGGEKSEEADAYDELPQPVAFAANQRDEVRDLGEKSAALAAEPGMKQQTFVAQPEEVTAFHVNQRNELIDLHGKSGALMATRSDQMQTFVLQGNMIGRKDENGPQGDGVNEDVCFTLDATDRHAVCAPEDVYAMTTGSYMQVAKEVAPTLMARDYKDPTTIAPAPHLNEGVAGTVATGAHPSGFNGQDAFNDRLVIDNPEAQPAPVTYTVRRLTPTECARLQGFPDWWCRDLGTENPTEEELAFWADVFETHRKIVTHAKKPKTEKQIRKWLADPYTDSAEYRIWGNGICLANAFFVLAGIAWCAGLEE